MKTKLIYDVGMHLGHDTEYYLQKGFQVVAIEAHPGLYQKALVRFEKEIQEGRLTILNVAVAPSNGEIDFYCGDEKNDWGTTNLEFVDRNKNVYGLTQEKIVVESRAFEEVLAEYGTPYYLKVDIEGSDSLCLEGLKKVSDRPKYISIEPDQKSIESAKEQISLMQSLGYDRFMLVNQALLKRVKCPVPAREGVTLDWQFSTLSSGPFGQDLQGEWVDADELISRFKKLLFKQSLFGREGGWQGRWCDTFLEKLYYKLNPEKLGWYDFHAQKRD